MSVYFFIQETLNNKKNYEDLLEIFRNGYEDFIIDFDQNFYDKYSLPTLHNWGDGFVRGDASIEDLVDLKNNLNEIFGGDEPAVYFEMDLEDENEYNTDIFFYLDKLYINEISEALEEAKDEIRLELISLLIDMLEEQDNHPKFVEYYSTIGKLEQYLGECPSEDVEANVSLFVDYDSHFSQYFLKGTTINGYLSLRSLTSVDKDFLKGTTINGYLSLDSLTSVDKDFTLKKKLLRLIKN